MLPLQTPDIARMDTFQRLISFWNDFIGYAAIIPRAERRGHTCCVFELRWYFFLFVYLFSVIANANSSLCWRRTVAASMGATARAYLGCLRARRSTFPLSSSVLKF